MRLQLYSERYPPTGMISGEGFSRVLGTPPMGPLSIMIREAVQNSWDAAKPGMTPRFRIHLRDLDTSQTASLRELMAELPEAYGEDSSLSAIIRGDQPIRVLEVSDYRTTGLGGPSRADDTGISEEATDFNDFIRNIGSARDKEMGGGTYGYGKSSLYRASTCQTILVHTRAMTGGHSVERLMGCHLAKQYKVPKGPDAGHYTGRHWWGEIADDEVVDPINGSRAAEAAASIGLDRSREEDSGTTSVILGPDLPEDFDDARVMSLFEQALLFNFWPKMLSVDGRKPAMEFELILNGQAVSIRSPEEVPPLRAYTDAFLKIKSKENLPGKSEIWCHRPRTRLGTLVLEEIPRRERKGEPFDEFIHDLWDRSRHIALMRPAELVVRYLPGPPHQMEEVEYGGVFICDPGVESTFALSEPPAHDGWIPDTLPKPSSTFVRVALNRMKRAMSDLVKPKSSAGTRAGELIKTAAMSLDLGQLIVSNEQSRGPGKRRKKQKPPTTGPKRSSWKLGRPDPVSLEMVDGAPALIFVSKVACDPGADPLLTASPRVVLEGSESETTAAGDRPVVLGWRINEEVVSSGETCRMEVGFKGDVEVAVSIPAGCAVSLKLGGEAVEEAEV